MNIPYGIIDLHCDTLTVSMSRDTGCPDTLDDPGRKLSLSNVPADVNWAQFCAIWLPNEIKGAEAESYFNRYADSFHRQMEKFSDRVIPCLNAGDIENAWNSGRRAAFLTVENGSAIAGKLENLEHVYSRGVRFMTLVWNGENEIASGSDTENGFSEFGRNAVAEMERLGIIADVSHLNDRGFLEFLDIAQKPFVATHSNARSVCRHLRNLTDDMIREMVRRECLVGLNYYIAFIDDAGDVKNTDMFYRHVCRFLELGAGDILALGSDFDGADLPDYLSSPQKVIEMYGYLLSRGVDENTLDKIYWKNALSFMKSNL